MTKKEVYKLLVLIRAYYDKFQFDQYKLDSWHMVLQKYSYDRVQENLLEYVVHPPNSPKISDLIHSSGGRSIPQRLILDLTAEEDLCVYKKRSL